MKYLLFTILFNSTKIVFFKYGRYKFMYKNKKFPTDNADRENLFITIYLICHYNISVPSPIVLPQWQFVPLLQSLWQLKIIVITCMTNLCRFGYSSPYISWENFCLNILFIEISQCIFMLLMRISIHCMYCRYCMIYTIISSII